MSRLATRVALPALIAAFACTSDDPIDDVAPGEVGSEAEHDEDPQATSDERDALREANHALTLDLYHAVREGDAAGLGFSISAYSINGVFGMLYGGSVAPARDEIAAVMGYTLEGERQHVAHNWLDGELESRNLAAVEGGGAEQAPVELRTGNGLWVDARFYDQLEPSFLELLATHYDAALQLAAFDSQPEVEREAINAWVSERTNELIPDLFPQGTIDPASTLVLVNALYLQAPWKAAFSDTATSPGDFTLLDGQVASVAMMRAPAFSGRYAANADYQAVAMPLRGDALELVIILPTDFSAFESALQPPTLAAVFAELEAVGDLQLSVPKFELEASLELSSELRELGMDAPFTDAGSFDGIVEGLGTIGAVVHQTVIKIDEKGTEAAAASGAEVGDGDGDVESPSLVVDRPFLLAIRDAPTNTLLFFGRVLDPNA